MNWRLQTIKIEPLSRRERGRGEGTLLRCAATALVIVVIVSLTACGLSGQARSSQRMDATPSAPTRTMHTPPMQTGGVLPPRSVANAQPDFNGIGPLRFGMSVAQMKQAWGKPLYGSAPAHAPKACYYLRSQENDYDLLLMVENDRFVRVDVKTKDKTAPGGGHIGMDAQQIENLYAGHVHVTPGKYDPSAKILDVAPPRIKDAGLIFETASGLVKSWRIGVYPQIDYVEGCA